MGRKQRGKCFPHFPFHPPLEVEYGADEPKLFSTTTTECEEGSKILMRNGFFLTLLNIVFGLLPVTIQGNTVTYSKISLATFYSTVALICLSYVSFVFVYFFLIVDLTRGDNHQLYPTSDVMALIIDRAAHVAGFLSLMLRGRFMAKQVPRIWFLLSKSMQNCIVNIHGNGDNFTKMRKLRKFCRTCILVYIAAIALNEGQVLYERSDPLLEDLKSEFWPYSNATTEEEDRWQLYLVMAGYIMWDLTTLSHVLVSLILSYFVSSLYFCLKSINEELMVVLRVNKFDLKCKKFDGPDHRNRKAKNISVIDIPTPMPSGSGSGSGSDSLTKTKSRYHQRYGSNEHSFQVLQGDEVYDDRDAAESEALVIRLNYIKDCYGTIEDVLDSISATWGISIFIEVQVLVATVLANLFFIFSSLFFSFQGNRARLVEEKERNDGTYGPYADLCIHFFFFYWLAVGCTSMHNESRKPFRILKDVNYHRFSPRVQNKIQIFKSDIASTNLQLTAADYFVVSKSLITSVCGSIITFLIVLVQFKSEEESKERCTCIWNISTISTNGTGAR